MGLNSTIKQVFFWVVIIVGAILLYQVFHNSGGSPPTELTYSELVKKVTDHEVQDAKIEPNKVTGNLTNRNHYTSKIAGEVVAKDLADLMNKNNVSVQFEHVTHSRTGSLSRSYDRSDSSPGVNGRILPRASRHVGGTKRSTNASRWAASDSRVKPILAIRPGGSRRAAASCLRTASSSATGIRVSPRTYASPSRTHS